jgi:hypothetical protein
MSLEQILLVISIVLLSVLTIIIVGAVIAVMLIRKRIKQLPIGKFGGILSLLPILKFILSRRQHSRR